MFGPPTLILQRSNKKIDLFFGAQTLA